MKDLTTSKKSDLSTMSLDEALEILEAAEKRIQSLAQEKDALLATKLVTEETLSNKVLIRVATSGVLTLTGTGMTGAYAGAVLELEALAINMILGMVFSTVATVAGIICSAHSGVKMATVFAPKDRKVYLRESGINEQLNQLVEEEFKQKELEAVTQASSALKIANHHLAKQDRKVSYVPGVGFEIEADAPISLSKWDKVRLDAIRQNGMKSVGISARRKELT